jgi:hypothetical protein
MRAILLLGGALRWWLNQTYALPEEPTALAAERTHPNERQPAKSLHGYVILVTILTRRVVPRISIGAPHHPYRRHQVVGGR